MLEEAILKSLYFKSSSIEQLQTFLSDEVPHDTLFERKHG